MTKIEFLSNPMVVGYAINGTRMLVVIKGENNTLNLFCADEHFYPFHPTLIATVAIEKFLDKVKNKEFSPFAITIAASAEDVLVSSLAPAADIINITILKRKHPFNAETFSFCCTMDKFLRRLNKLM